MYVIIANTAHDPAAKADEDYKVKARTACPQSFTGWIRSERLVTKHSTAGGGANGGDTNDSYERLSETWTLGAEGTYKMGTIEVPSVDAHWSGRYEHHSSTVTTLSGPCQSQPVLQATDGTGSGMSVSNLVISDPGTGTVYLSPTSATVGSFNAPQTFYAETCDGMSFTSTSDNMVYESLAVVSTYAVLTPDTGDPNHFHGGMTVVHSETPEMGGSDLVDWVVTWDVTRNVK
jgi:hypothetical protein